MKKITIFLFILTAIIPNLFAKNNDQEIKNYNQQIGMRTRNVKDLVSSTFRISLKDYPGAFNPSIIAAEGGYFLTFRYLPEPVSQPWISYIGVVFLDQQFQPVDSGDLLDVRFNNIFIPSQAEDARIFTYRGKYFITYNDNPEVTNTSDKDRRDIYIAEVIYDQGRFTAGFPIKLIHPQMLEKRKWEKNWIPFEWNGSLLWSYSFNPHEVLSFNWNTGYCTPAFFSSCSIDWKWGNLRGGTPPLLIDGEYLAFFHTAKEMISGATQNKKMWHYFMGAYTFSATPPFKLTKVSPMPLNEKSFYVNSENPKRVIYPGGFVVSGDNIYLAYGKDDTEIWIAVINKNKLMNSLKAVK